jgi:hypothetical protein
MEKFQLALAFVKEWISYIIGLLRGLSFKTQASLAVCVSIVALLLMFGAPDRKTVAKALPTYATPADLTLAKASLQRDIDGLSADIHQMRIELNAVEEKLAEPKPVQIETGSVKKTKKRR